MIRCELKTAVTTLRGRDRCADRLTRDALDFVWRLQHVLASGLFEH